MKCGRSSFIYDTFLRQEALVNHECIQVRKLKMTANEPMRNQRLSLVSSKFWPRDSTPLRSADSGALSACVDIAFNRVRESPTWVFSHEATFFPLGFPLHIVSNSSLVLEAAEESWGQFEQVFTHTPLELHIGVKEDVEEEEEEEGVPLAPIHSVNGHLLVNAADVDNFFVADLLKGRAIGWVTETTSISTMYLRYHFIEAATLSMLATLRAVPLHAACIHTGESGVLLCGESGAGKSSLAYAGSRAGWTFICDDACYLPLEREDRMVIGNCHQVRFRPSAAELFPEIRDYPITPRAAGKPSIEVHTSEWPTLSISRNTDVNHIVFLNRNLGDRQELVRLPASEVWPWFSQHLLVPELRPIHDAALTRLLDRRNL